MKLKLKTSKSALKRFKISSRGKFHRRSVRMNHFNAKQTGATRRNKRADKLLSKSNFKDIKNLLPYESLPM